jgi:hypothetical protein
MPSDQEDEIDSLALKKLEDIQRQKMIDLFGFDPDSRDSTPPAKLKKRSRSDVSGPITASKVSRTDKTLSKDPSSVLDIAKKPKKNLISDQTGASQRRTEDSEFFAGADAFQFRVVCD